MAESVPADLAQTHLVADHLSVNHLRPAELGLALVVALALLTDLLVPAFLRQASATLLLRELFVHVRRRRLLGR